MLLWNQIKHLYYNLKKKNNKINNNNKYKNNNNKYPPPLNKPNNPKEKIQIQIPLHPKVYHAFLPMIIAMKTQNL